MSSIHKDPRGRSPYWYAAFTDGTGKRRFVSTKATDRKVALKIALAWQDAADHVRRRELTANQCRRVLGELLSVISPDESLANHTVEDWMRGWVEGKRGSTAPATYSKYRQVTEAFLEHLGKRSRAPLSAISLGDIARFRDGLRAQGYSVRTANIAKGIISAPFALAVRQGILPFDPCGAVDNLRARRAGAVGREPFTLEEVRRVAAEASGDWLGLILCCATTGLRISDAAALTWGDIDLEQGRLRVITRKTDTRIVAFLHDDFRSWLFGQSERGIGRAQVFPSLANVETGGSRGLSTQFRALMERAGITERITNADGKKGRSRSSKSAHCLRHFFVTELANQNVPADVRKLLVGHSDSKTHAGYSHYDDKIRRDAISRIPSLIGPQKAS
jgi:integrase